MRYIKKTSSNFIIDVPETWGIAADGSMMEVFNKIERIEDWG